MSHYARSVGQGALADVLRRHAAAYDVPGAALGILVGGRPVTAYHGVADVVSRRPVTAVTRFGIGSLTKTMVASAVAVLAAAGGLSLDDPVASRVPELQLCAWARTATLRDLMANRSPVPLWSALEFGFDEHRDGDDQALSRLLQEVAREASSSGAHWSYSNVGWCVLGRAVETATGRTWEEAMRSLLEPAGLSRTWWATRSSTVRAVGHEPSAQGPRPVEPLLSRAYGPAGTTTVSTLEDLLRYAAWHLSEPALAPLRLLHADVAVHGWFDAWCLGLARFDWEDATAWGWDGIVHGERSVLRVLPEQQGAVVVLANGSAGRALARAVLPEVVPEWYGVGVAPLRLTRTPDASEDLTPYAGTYGWPDRLVDVTATARGLVVTEDGIPGEAVPLDRRTFLLDRADPDRPTITFADFDHAGRPGVLYDVVWGLPRL